MVVPVGWVIKELKSEIEFQNGTAHENVIKEYGKYIVANSKFISTEGKVKKFSDVCITPCHRNDILMVMSDVPNGRAIGKCFLVDIEDKYTLNQRICRMRSYYNNEKLLYYILDRNQYFLSFDDGVKQTNLRRDDILKCSIMLPENRVEQNAIAEALSDMDSLITSMQKLINKKKAVKQGTMQELLTGKRRLPGFHGEWERKELGDCILGQPSYGVNAPAVQYNPALPTYIRITDITEEGKFSHCDRASVIHNNFTNYLLNNNDIVLARTGASVGKSYLYNSRDGRLVYAGFLIKISINSQIVNAKFIFYIFHTKKYWDWVGTVSMRSGQPGINSAEYASFEFSIPPIYEQNAIVNFLSDMDNEIEQLERKLTKYRQIKQGMMEELLTGHIRLAENGEEI